MKQNVVQTGTPAGEGGLLLQLLKGRRLEGFEKSFKMANGMLLSNRYLLGIHRNDATPASLCGLCERLAMPAQQLAAFRENLPGANTVHFGFEGHATGGVYKVYLEYAGRLPRTHAGGGDTAPVLLHLAYKWDALDRSKCTVAKYVCHPRLSTAGILARLADMYSGHADRSSFEAARSIIEFAACRTREALMYLEVSEEGNPRSSFDINLHEAGLRLQDIGHWLSALRVHYSIPPDRFERIFAQISAEKLGHMSGGISREGGDFMTVYYAAGSR